MEEFDETLPGSTGLVTEQSCPHHQFKEDRKAMNKLQGQKCQSQQQHSKKTNWQSSFLWLQIKAATIHAGKPWSPHAIIKEAKRMDTVAFECLTEQVISC